MNRAEQISQGFVREIHVHLLSGDRFLYAIIFYSQRNQKHPVRNQAQWDAQVQSEHAQQTKQKLEELFYANWTSLFGQGRCPSS
jgi:hypothetical protein